jgi:hypothetical protein
MLMDSCKNDGLAAGEFIEWSMKVVVPTIRTGPAWFHLARSVVDLRKCGWIPNLGSDDLLITSNNELGNRFNRVNPGGRYECDDIRIESDTVWFNIIASNDSTILKRR